MIYDLTPLIAFALFGLRIMVAIIFFTSGWSHVKKPEKRGESIGMSPGLTWFLGAVEMAAAISVGLGIYIQIGAFLLIAVMVGATYKKMVEWDTGFYSKEGIGWHYDILLLFANMVFLTLGGGSWVLVG